MVQGARGLTVYIESEHTNIDGGEIQYKIRPRTSCNLYIITTKWPLGEPAKNIFFEDH